MTQVQTRKVSSVLEITIDIPKANAIDATTSRILGQVFADFRDDSDMRVAIFTGAGSKFFSAGWDLKAAKAGEHFEADFGEGGFGGFPELEGLNKPVIAAVNGMAVGGGFELVLAADLVVASDHAEFFFGELGVGVIPDAGSVRLPRMVPNVVAKELILTGRRISAYEAMGLGLVNRVVPAHELIEATHELANEVCAAAPLAVEAALEVMGRSPGFSVEEALEVMRSGGLSAYTRMLGSEDAQEGPKAFAEKRQPRWKGR